MGAGTDWVDLLAGQAPVEALEAHRRALVAAGTPVEEADSQARAALEVAALLAERRQRALELAALNDVAERLAVVRDPQDLLEEVVGAGAAPARRRPDLPRRWSTTTRSGSWWPTAPAARGWWASGCRAAAG